MNKDYQMNLISLVTRMNYGHEDWQSSAEDLQNDLGTKGINDVKVYYRYNLPDGMLPVSYMIKNALNWFYIRMCGDDFFRREVLDNWFDLVVKSVIKDEKQVSIFRQQMISDIESKKADVAKYKNEVMRDYKLLLKLNPELPRARKENDISSIMDGAVFGFAPNDIKYFCEIDRPRSRDQERRLYKRLRKHKIYISYILAPETVRCLISKLKERKL